MAKAKYDWDAITKDYQDGVQSNEICEKYNLTPAKLINFARNNKIKRPNGFKRKKITSKPYIWNEKNVSQLKDFLSKKIPRDPTFC